MSARALGPPRGEGRSLLGGRHYRPPSPGELQEKPLRGGASAPRAVSMVICEGCWRYLLAQNHVKSQMPLGMTQVKRPQRCGCGDVVVIERLMTLPMEKILLGCE